MSPVKKAKRGSARKRAAAKPKRARTKSHGAKAAPKPKLAVIRRAPPKPLPKRAQAPLTEFAGAKAGASPKDLALFGLERARVAVHAAIQGLSAGSANRPIAPGRWSPRRLLLQLAHWDREIVQKHLEKAAALTRNAREQKLLRDRAAAMNRSG